MAIRAVLEWISIYWFSRAGPSASSFIYYEVLEGGLAKDWWDTTTWTSVPLGVSHFAKEPLRVPESYVSWPSARISQSPIDAAQGGHTSSAGSCSKYGTRKAATSPRSRSPRRLQAISGRCMARVGRRTPSSQARMVTTVIYRRRKCSPLVVNWHLLYRSARVPKSDRIRLHDLRRKPTVYIGELLGQCLGYSVGNSPLCPRSGLSQRRSCSSMLTQAPIRLRD